MEFLTLSLPETFFFYTGLAIQLILRASMRYLPGTIVLCGLGVLCVHALRRRGSWLDVLLYFLGCVLICLLFWPEASIFGDAAGYTVNADQIGSYAAVQDPQATVVTAEDTGQVPEFARVPVLVPSGLRLLLQPLVGTPLRLAIAMNTGAHRTFAAVMPIHWLLGLELTTEVTNAVGDWVHNCYLPTMTALQVAGGGRTVEDLLPWDGSALRQALGSRMATLGAQTGIPWIGPNRPPSVAPEQVRCDTYLDAVELRTQSWLFEKRSPAGTPLLDVFQQELGLDPIQQARFILYREMLRVAGPAIPAPSLTAQYAALRAAGTVADLTSRLFGAQKPTQAITGAVAGEFERSLEGLSWLIGIAVFLTWYGPYVLGILQMVLLALFPIVVLWSLIPGQQFMPLVMYFVAMLFTFTMPLWWVLVDEAAKLAAATAPAAGTFAIGAITGALWSLMITSLGILIIPVATGMVLFLSFRSLGGLWRGATL